MPDPDKEFAGVICGVVQEKVTPAGMFEKFVKVGGVPLQTNNVSLKFITGTGFTVTTTSNGNEEQFPAFA